MLGPGIKVVETYKGTLDWGMYYVRITVHSRMNVIFRPHQAIALSDHPRLAELGRWHRAPAPPESPR
jgi:hypothetical protein